MVPRHWQSHAQCGGVGLAERQAGHDRDDEEADHQADHARRRRCSPARRARRRPRRRRGPALRGRAPARTAPCQPSSSAPDEQDVAADPHHRGRADDRQHGEHLRHAGDEPAPDPLADGRPDSTMRSPTSSIFTISATTPYTTAVITTATTTRMIARDTNPSSITSLSAITMISPERMKSVRIAPAIVCSSCVRPRCASRRAASCSSSCVVREAVVDLLRALEAQVRAAEHQDDLDEHRARTR